MINNNRILSALLCGASALCFATAARAQSADTGAQVPASDAGSATRIATTDPTSSADANPQDIVVTGSRTIVNGMNSPTPVTVVSTADLAATTPTTIAEGLNTLPVFAGSRGNTTTGAANQNATGNFLSLRGFGVARTLVLQDGRRVPATSATGQVDTNTLPGMLVSRVEVVTGGASAVYGSDAVTGVVNFVLDRNFNGVKAEANGGVSQIGDDVNWKVGLAVGHSFMDGKLHLEGSYEHYNSDGIKDKLARPVGAGIYCSVGAGTAAQPFYTIANCRNNTSTFGGLIRTGPLADMQFATNGVLSPFVHGVRTTTSSAESGGDGIYQINTPVAGYQKTDQAFGRADFQASDNLRFFSQLSYSKNLNGNTFNAASFNGIIFSATNAYLSPAIQAAASKAGAPLVGGLPTFSFGRFFANEDATDVKSITRNITVTSGFNWKFGSSWELEGFYTFGQSKLHVNNIGVIINTKRAAAVDAVLDPATNQIVCRVTLTNPGLYPGCVPFNPFGPTSQTPGSANYFRSTEYFDLTNRMDDFGLNLTGDLIQLPAGPVRVALSGEYRDLSLNNVSSASPTELADCTGLRFNCTQGTTTKYGNNITQSMSASQTVKEVAIEATVPILKDIPFIQALSINGAGRYTDYSTSGSVRTWKVGIDWKIADALTLRATRSQDIRAPTLYDLFQPVSRTSAPFADVHTNTTQSVSTISRGNDQLVPEIAQTLTAGVVLRPGFLRRFSLSLDYFRINIDNAITSVSGGNQSIIATCENSGGTSPLCVLYARPLPFSDRTAANFPTAIYSQPQNVSQTWTNGVDIEANYTIDLAEISASLLGRLTYRLFGTYQPKLAYITLPGQPVVNNAGVGNAGANVIGGPSWRITSQTSYQIGAFSIQAQTRWRNKLKRSGDPTIFYADPPVPAVSFTDMTVSYRLKSWGADTQVFFNVRNVFNTISPVLAGASGTPNNGNNVAQGDDVVGRAFTAGLRTRF